MKRGFLTYSEAGEGAMSTERVSRTDKELWRSIAPERGVAPEAVSNLDFAAWLEGRLSEAATARIEAAIAADPELRRAAFDLADILGKPLPAVPARLAVRAQALVGFGAERQTRGGLFGRLFPSGPFFALQRAAMVAMVIVVAGAGFVMGGGLGDSLAQQRYGSDVATSTTATTSSELSDFFVSDGI
ncbi:MAG: hypothetical protein Q8L22_12440 [Reyranella sp.]|nr:hypothetical protein [Reyranella sp.]